MLLEGNCTKQDTSKPQVDVGYTVGLQLSRQLIFICLCFLFYLDKT